MTITEITAFANKMVTHNERICITLNDHSEINGHFFNNKNINEKTDNLWNFVILEVIEPEKKFLVINGDDIVSIQKKRLF